MERKTKLRRRDRRRIQNGQAREISIMDNLKIWHLRAELTVTPV